MENREIIQFLHIAEQLKNYTRHCVTSTGRAESVAEHSWRVSLMALLLEPDIPDVDFNKVIRMTILHDLGEAITGDIPSFEKTKEDCKKEDKEIFQLLEKLPNPLKEDFKALFEEMLALETKEAKVYKALDKMEAVLQHNESPLETWLPLEYELNQTYGLEESRVHEKLLSLREMMIVDTKEKLIQEADKMKR